jgi:hypothetical protein
MRRNRLYSARETLSKRWLVAGIATATMLVTGCTAGDAGMAGPTASGPLPSPRPAFTGIALPATSAPAEATHTAVSNAARSDAAVPSAQTAPTSGSEGDTSLPGTHALTILYTNDTRGYVDPCG